MNRKSAVDRGYDSIDREITLFTDSHFDRMCCISAEREMRRDTDATSPRAFAIVFNAPGDEFGQPCQATWVERWSAVIAVLKFSFIAEQIDAQLNRVLSGLVRDLVDEALYDERVRCVPWRAPRTAGNADRVVKIFNAQVVDNPPRKIVGVELRLP